MVVVLHPYNIYSNEERLTASWEDAVLRRVQLGLGEVLHHLTILLRGKLCTPEMHANTHT